MTKKKNMNELLNHILAWGIDIWLFDQIFSDTGKDYIYYDHLWNNGIYVSRIRMDEKAFNITEKLLKEYKKHNV